MRISDWSSDVCSSDLSDLPTSDPVPCSMMAGAKVKARVPDPKLYSLLREHVLLAEGMLHLSHLGHQVGRVDEFRLGGSAGHDDVQHTRAHADVGRAEFRVRGCLCGEVTVEAVCVKKKI